MALTCTVITTIWWRGALACGSCVAHVWQLMCTVITTISRLLQLYGVGEPSHVAHVLHIMCTVITTIWWRASCVAHVHGNYYYMVEGSPHMWLMCTVFG